MSKVKKCQEIFALSKLKSISKSRFFIIPIFVLTSSVGLLLMTSSSKQNSNNPPSPVSAQIPFSNTTYACAGYTNPVDATLSQPSNRFFSIDITGDNIPIFSRNYQNLNSTRLNWGGCVNYIEVPNTGSYKITCNYRERGICTSNQTNPNFCARWYKQVQMYSGVVPTCNSTPITVNDINPFGFYGVCN